MKKTIVISCHVFSIFRGTRLKNPLKFLSACALGEEMLVYICDTAMHTILLASGRRCLVWFLVHEQVEVLVLCLVLYLLQRYALFLGDESVVEGDTLVERLSLLR
jgi:hypothetical protein